MSDEKPINPEEPEKKYRKGTHPNSVAALKRIKPGQVLNPKGTSNLPVRQKNKELKEYFDEFLNIIIPIKAPDGKWVQKTVMDAIIMALIAKACKGDIRAIELVLERNFGKEEQKLLITHEAALREFKYVEPAE